MRILSVACALAGLGLIACSNGGSPTAPTTTTGTTTTTTMAPAWALEGTRLDNAATGIGGVIADTSTIQLLDGRWRMFFFNGEAQRSAISPDGLSFTYEPGEKIGEGFGHIRVVRLPDSRIRAFVIFFDGITSFISDDDGATFTREEGTRISAAAAGMSQISGVSNIVRTRDGLYRVYFSDLPTGGQGPVPHMVKSAYSADLFNWVVDAGVRIGPGSTITGSAEHPGALLNTDGSISLFYFRNTDFKLMYAVSADGLTFSSEADTGVAQANDTDVLRLSNGTVRMYYNWGDDAGGYISSATHAGGFAATAAQLAAPLVAPRPAGGMGWRFSFGR